MRRNSADQRSSIGRAADVLGVFDARHSELSLADITRRAQLPHSTAHRVVKELCEAGFLARTLRRTYVVGIRLWEIGALAPSTLPLRQIAMPYMQVLHDSLQEHVQLLVRDGHEGLIVERLSGARSFKLVSHPGGRLPLHTSAAGKVLLAHAPSDFVDDFLKGPLRALTPQSIVDRVELAAELAEVREQGYAIVRGEMPPVNANSVAAGVFDRAEVLVAAISVVVPASRAAVRALVPPVVSTASAISSALQQIPG